MPIPGVSILKSGGSEFAKVSSLAPPIGAVLISLVILVLIVWPKFSDVLRLRTANQDLAIRVESLAKKADKLSSLDRLELEQQLVSAEQLLPSDKSVFTIVSQFEKTAGASGVLLNRLELTPGTLSENATLETAVPAAPQTKAGAANSAPKIQLKIQFSGDYRSMVTFLNNILSLPRTLIVRELTIASSSGQSSQIKASMLVDAYWNPLPKQLSAIESAVGDLTPLETARLARITSTGLSSLPIVPSVPLGRPDLFAPF